jgi:hypothetical protein
VKSLNCREHVRSGKIQNQLNNCVCVNVHVCVILEKTEKSLCGDGVSGDCVQVLHSCNVN